MITSDTLWWPFGCFATVQQKKKVRIGSVAVGTTGRPHFSEDSPAPHLEAAAEHHQHQILPPAMGSKVETDGSLKSYASRQQEPVKSILMVSKLGKKWSFTYFQHAYNNKHRCTTPHVCFPLPPLATCLIPPFYLRS